jgi:hypothetical protein
MGTASKAGNSMLRSCAQSRTQSVQTMRPQGARPQGRCLPILKWASYNGDPPYETLKGFSIGIDIRAA